MPSEKLSRAVPLLAIRDDASTIRKHTFSGSEVVKSLRKGREAHIFLEEVDLRGLEEKVWTEGSYQGRVGSDQRADFERFVWRSPTPIGRRIEAGKPDLPLYWVEIKDKVLRGQWLYHLTPRTRPAS